MQKIKNFLFIHWFWLLLLLLTAIGGVVRLYQLGQVPHGMSWDEAADGYNGFAIMTTHRDEWLVKMPVSFRSFGDYKAPLAIYINGIFTHFLGLNLWAVRLPYALGGIVGIPGLILLTEQLVLLTGYGDQKKARSLALLTGFLLTFSPWHIQLSRIAFEMCMMTSFVIWGWWCLCCLLNQKKRTETQRKALPQFLISALLTLGSAVFLAASIYTYHSPKIVVPLLMLTFCLLFWRQFWQQKKWLGVAAISGLALLWPFIKDTFWSAGGERFTQATVFGLPISLSQKLIIVVEHFFRHFALDYLIFGATTTLRHSDGRWGVLLPTTFLLVMSGVVFGLTVLWLKRSEIKTAKLKFLLMAVLWILVGTVPAAMGRDVPHQTRDLLALFGFLFLATFGWSELTDYLERIQLNKQVSGSKGEKNLLVKSVAGTLILLHLFFAAQYFDHYYTVFARQSASDFQDGYIQATQFAIAQEDHSDKILFTSAYGQPYIYVLFVRQTDPVTYQHGALIKYEFSDRINVGDLDRPNTTIVATPQEISPQQVDHNRPVQLVNGSDGKLRFVLIAPKK